MFSTTKKKKQKQISTTLPPRYKANLGGMNTFLLPPLEPSSDVCCLWSCFDLCTLGRLPNASDPPINSTSLGMSLMMSLRCPSTYHKNINTKTPNTIKNDLRTFSEAISTTFLSLWIFFFFDLVLVVCCKALPFSSTFCKRENMITNIFKSKWVNKFYLLCT